MSNSQRATDTFLTQHRMTQRRAASGDAKPSGIQPFGNLPSRQQRAIADTVGNTKATATVVVTPGSQTLREFVSRRDSDFYRLTLDTASDVKVTFVNQSKDSIFKALFNGNGSVFTSKRQKQAGNIQPRQQAIAVYRAIRSGTYYVQIKGSSANSSKYKLSISVTPAPAETGCGCGG
ncbi:MAG TPA: hypothetical protein V6C57_26980 [Coleofasciculaceae cyanobacterium]